MYVIVHTSDSELSVVFEYILPCKLGGVATVCSYRSVWPGLLQVPVANHAAELPCAVLKAPTWPKFQTL